MGKQSLLLIVVFISIMYIKESVSSTVFILPSNHGQWTLNEWIENGTNPFTNGTTVVLHPGLHFINSTKDRLITENKNVNSSFSIKLTGQYYESVAHVVCLHYFSFTFIDIQEVILSQITLQSCTLMIKLTDFSLSFLKLTVPGLNISKEYVSIPNNVSIKPFAFALSWISLITSYIEIHTTLNGIVLPAFPAMINISDCNLQGTPVHILPQTPATKGIQWLDIKQVVYMNSFPYMYPCVTLLSISHVEEARFTDIIFQNNFCSLISLGYVTKVEFSGHFIVSHNSGEWGLDIYSCERVHFSPNTQVMFYYNTFRLSSIIFHFNHAIEWTDTAVHMKDNAIEFESHLEIYGPTMVQIIRSNFLFENNRGLCTLNKGNNAIMRINNCNSLLYGIFVKESTFTFFNNIAQLSGGLTLVQSMLFVDQFRASFGYNQGGDGGAIAFYRQAKIL